MEMVSALRDFASRRTDIFADDEITMGAKLGEKKKKEVRVTWDGHVASAGRVAQEALQGKTVEDQLKAMQEKKMSKPTLGPR
jgi:hypothetical protein